MTSTSEKAKAECLLRSLIYVNYKLAELDKALRDSNLQEAKYTIEHAKLRFDLLHQQIKGA